MPSHPPPPPPPARERAALAALLLLVALLYLPALRCGFTTWDDGAFCLHNPDVARPNLLRIFDLRNYVVADWTPLATVSYAAERALLGPAPWVPHATNVVLHLLAVFLVHRLLRDLGFGPWTCLGVALVYGVHPLQVESVAWISARKNVLVAVFSLAFLRSTLAGRPVRATAWFLLALCSKATAVGLPLVAAAALWLDVLRPGQPRPRTAWAWIAAWCAFSVGRAWISLDAQAGVLARTAALGFAGRMAAMGSVLTTQARQVLWPDDLSVLYDPPQRAWDDPVLLAQWAAILTIVAACAALARRDRRLIWLGVFALAMLAPTLNVFPAPALQADRYLHLPMIAIGAFLVAGLARLAPGAASPAPVTPLARLRRHAPAALLLAWALAVCVPFTLARLADWRSHESLFLATVETNPTSSTAWNQLGVGRVERRDFAGAITAYGRAQELAPTDLYISMNLALALLADDRDAECERQVRALLSAAATHRPSPTPLPGEPSPEMLAQLQGEAHGLLGCIAARAGLPDAAAREFAEAQRLAPRSNLVRTWIEGFRAGTLGRK